MTTTQFKAIVSACVGFVATLINAVFADRIYVFGNSSDEKAIVITQVIVDNVVPFIAFSFLCFCALCTWQWLGDHSFQLFKGNAPKRFKELSKNLCED